MAQKTDTLMLNLAFTATLFVASWFNLNFFSSVYWLLCLIFIYFVCTQDERHVFNNPNIRYMILTIVGYSLVIVLIYIGLSVHFSLTKNIANFDETMQLLGFNKITSEDFNWTNGLSVLFSILNFLIGVIYYHNYVTRSKEIGYNEFLEVEISEEERQKDYHRLVRRQSVHRLARFNLLAEFCVVGVIALNDGIIISPFMLIFFAFVINHLICIKELNHFKMWTYLISPLKLLTFLLLYVQFFFRIDYILEKLPEQWLIIFGYIFKDQTLSFYGLIPMVLLFIVNCLQSSVLNLIGEKSWKVHEDDLKEASSEGRKGLWYEALWDTFKANLLSFSMRVYQMLAILWCMLHPSGLMVLILLFGVFGMFVQKEGFKKALLVAIQLIGTIYITLQMVFNITWFFDSFAESKELFLIGIFKYCLFKDNALAGSLDLISKYDMVAYRALGFALDLLIFTILTKIYYLNKGIGKIERESKPGTPKKEPILIKSHDEIEETKEIERLTDREYDKPSFLEISRLKPPKVKPLKTKIGNFVRKFFEGLLLNAAKFILVFLFFASVSIIDGVHMGYFILFLLFSALSNRITERIWKLQMAYTIIVLLTLYIYQVLSGYFPSIIAKDSAVLAEYIGIKRFRSSLLWEYKEHLILIFSLFLQKIAFESEVYRRLSKEYSDDEFEKKAQGAAKKKFDLFSKFFLQYGLILCYASLLFVGFYENPSLLSLLYLLMLSAIIMIELMAAEEKKALDTLNRVWPLFIILNFMIVTVRYLFQIGFFSLLLSKTELEETLPLQDIGLEKDPYRICLITDAVVLILINTQRKVFAQEEYLEALKYFKRKDQQQSLERSYGSLSYYCYCLSVYLKTFTFLHISKILLFAIFVLIIDSKTCLGLFYLAFLILILIIEKDNRWSASWIPIYFYSLVIIFSQYLLQLKIAENFMQDLMNWGGFSFEKSKIINIFLENCFIQFLCILQRKSQRWKRYIVPEKTVLAFYEENEAIIKDFKVYKKRVQKYKDSLVKQEDFLLENELISDKIEEEKLPFLESRSSNLSEIYEPADFEVFKRFQNYIINLPIMDFNWVSLKIDHAYQKTGFELALLWLVIAAFYKLNVISILYILLAAYFSFHCKYLTLEDNFSNRKVDFLLAKWRFVYFLISLGLLFQYAVLLWFPLNWNVFYPWKEVLFMCDESSKNSFSKVREFHDESDLVKCLNNWKKWLFLERFKDYELFMDFSVLFLMILYEFYLLRENRKREESSMRIQAMDSGDFTYRRGSWIDWIKFLYYCYFYKMALVVVFVIGAIDNLAGTTDLISVVYLIISMYLHYNSHKLSREKNRIWKKVEAFNNIVMILYIIYQAPVFPCPIIVEDRYYFTSEECLAIQANQKTFFQWKHMEMNPDNLTVLYVLFSQTLGLNKIANGNSAYIVKPIFTVIFFFMGILQRQIFNHPYYSEYVRALNIREKENSIKRALRYIENNHLKRIWSYENLNTQKEVYLSLQNRVDKKIKQWEELLQLKTPRREKTIEISVEVPEQKIASGEGLDLYSEEMRIKAERICYSKELPTLSLMEVLAILDKAKGDERKIEIYIKQEKFSKTRKVIEEIYMSKAIGLNKYWGERSRELKDEQDYLRKHIEKLERQLGVTAQLGAGNGNGNGNDYSPGDHGSGAQGSEGHNEGKNNEDLTVSPTKQKRWWKNFLKESREALESANKALKKFLLRFTHRTFFQTKHGEKLEEEQLALILLYFTVSQMDKICYMLMIVNHVVNDNLLSLVFPCSLFLYALLENPIPLKTFWKFIIFYTVAIIIVKFLYQLPIFCGSPPFTLFFYTGDSVCISRSFSESELISRIDYIIGIHKFSGNSSFPKNQGFFLGVLCDYLVLLFLLLHRSLLEKLGFWHHVTIEKSLFEIPQFDEKETLALKLAGNKRKDLEDNPIEKKDLNTRNFGEIIELRNEGLEKEKLGFLERVYERVRGFCLRVVPNYLPKEHEVVNVSTKERKIRPTHSSLIKPGKDYYSPAFAVCLLILGYFMLFYQKMVGKKESISETLDNNSQFSGDLVLAIIFILAWIILDRVIYNLKKNSNRASSQDYGKRALLMKIFIHVLIFILIHYYICFRLPLAAKTFFCNSPSLVICYLFFMWYLYYSSHQIKFGYPEADTTQIFTTSTDLLTRIAFKVYRAIPFLTELKAILDWTVIRTSLDLFQWIKLDDAYANLYLCKAEMAVRKENKPGSPRKFWEKCSNGCLLVVFLIIIIIGPILLFSTLNPILQTNNVNSGVVSLELTISPKKTNANSTEESFHHIFEIYRAENLEISNLDSNAFNILAKSFIGIDQDAQGRVQKVALLPYSERNWDISKPRLLNLEEYLDDAKNNVYLTAKWSFVRSHPPGNEMARGSNTIILIEGLKKSLKNAISENSTEKSGGIQIPNLFPMFLGLGQSSFALARELQEISSQSNNVPVHITCTLTYYNNGEGTSYWGLERRNQTTFGKIGLFDENANNKISFVLLNDFVFGSLFGASISNISVIGLYATFVFAIGKFIRLFFANISQRVIYEEMPKPDDLMDLCESIYIARAEGDLRTEQALYELLIRIYRSPEILIKLTGTGIEGAHYD